MRVGRFRVGLMLGLGVGFVAGAASGRERYDQIEAGARRAVSLGRRAVSSTLVRSAGEKMGAVGSGVKGRFGTHLELEPQPEPAGPPAYPTGQAPRSSF